MNNKRTDQTAHSYLGKVSDRVSKKEGKDHESLQSSTTPDPGYLKPICSAIYIRLARMQSELPRPIPRNSVESDGCTSWIYFDNAGENLTLTLYHVTLTSHKPC